MNGWKNVDTWLVMLVLKMDYLRAVFTTSTL